MTLLPYPLIRALNVAVFELRPNEKLRLISDSPEWLTRLWPEAVNGDSLYLESRFLFLSDFTQMALEHWQASHRTPLDSELWTEIDAKGSEILLKATALLFDEKQLFLVQPSTVDQERFRTLLQEGRNLAIDHYQLLKSVADREVLLHCVAHDLSTPLAGIRASLKLLRTDNLVDDDGEELITLGLRQIDKLQVLTREILASVSTPERPDTLTDLVHLVSEVVAALQPLAAQLKVSINVEASAGTLHASTDALHLERVLFNLLDNALRHAPPETTILVQLVEEKHAFYFRIVDEGEGVPDELRELIFEKNVQGDAVRGQSGLGLYFCRIAVEGWGGQIGYLPGSHGGACFWFTLPRITGPR